MRQIIYMFFRMSRPRQYRMAEICNKAVNRGTGWVRAVDNKGPKVG